MSNKNSNLDVGRRPAAEDWSSFDLTRVANKFGTPLFVIDKEVLIASATNFVKTFSDRGIRARTFFSVKTNPVPSVIRMLADAGIGAEVRALHEFRLAREAGLVGEQIVVNGTVKSDELLDAAIGEDVAVINVESADELLRVERIAERSGKRPRLGLRINPALKSRRWDLTLSTGSSDSPMGFQMGSDDWRRAIDILKMSHTLRLTCLHCHIGTGIRSSKPYSQALSRLTSIRRDLQGEGLRPTTLDLGGGFSEPRIKTFTLFDAARQFIWDRGPTSPGPKSAVSLPDEVADLCRKHLSGLERDGIGALEVFLEPGRALCATSQVLLLRVLRVAGRPKGTPWVLCDGGAMSLSPLLLGEYHEIAVAGKETDAKVRRYNLLGSMPTPLDVISVGRALPVLEVGDVLVVMDVGAYFTSLSNTFAGPRPAIVLREDDEVRLIRRRETYEDLFERDAAMEPSPA